MATPVTPSEVRFSTTSADTTSADLGSLENYCLAQARVRQAEASIQGETDADVITKLARMQDKAMATARQLAAELGLTPVSRSRPTMREEGEADDLNPLDVS